MNETCTNNPPVQLILGAYGGIGSEVVRLLEAAGNRVAVSGRDRDRLDSLDVSADAGRWTLDATQHEAVEQVVKSVAEANGRIDGIVNCVGSVLLKPAHLTRQDDWQATMDTNLGSAFAVTRAAGRVMTGGGSVVLLSSSAARVGLANHEAIAAAKAGVLGLTLSAAATYASKNLRFNAVAPGLVATPMTERITRNPAAAKTSASMHALGRLGRPGDVARMIVWLLDPGNDWVTGQVFGIDGGLATVRAG